MEKTFDYFKANPAGNITGFVVWPVYPGYRVAYAKAIMEQIDSDVEQVAFISPSYDGPPLRMDMMGGEFCGNATRTYGLYAATFLEEKGDVEVEVYVSGVNKPLNVLANVEKSYASVEVPPAKKISQIEIDGRNYMVVEFDGITHTIIDDKSEDKEFVERAIDIVRKEFDSSAYGILFLNEKNFELIPYVYVVGSDTIFREGSCGSGSIAAGYYLNKNSQDENFKVDIKQPKGSIEVKARKSEDGQLLYSIGGKIELGEKKKVTITISPEQVKKITQAHKEAVKEGRE
ncbi:MULTISPECIES: hypothetical protein [Peptoniphilus]|uniref:hypothetical protein n=1 Tax=Peptoniphilus TaxID=162289 RepID=UPI0001DA9EF0|nr:MULTISPECIES: hypothetical protein [Peptoniphilus]EFI41542.1 hypothetical protein HMPREF0629_00164 [Peptoniphilus sp. oral taxon 386 str. F0131]